MPRSATPSRRSCAIESDIGRRGVVGVGAPGAISTHTGLVKNSNTVVVNGKPLDVDLAQALGRSVRVANDANCFALSEAVDGAGRGAGVVFGVILGTGVGGGVVVDGRILEGRNRVAGEWGHTPLPWMTPQEYPGAPCFCGHKGCIETFLCGAGLSRDYEQRSGARRPATEIAALAAAGDTGARETLERYQDRLARALAMVVDLIDPDVIVLAAVVRELEQVAERAASTAAWISRPLVGLRVAIGLLVVLVVVGLAVSLTSLQVHVGVPTLPELVQGIEAAINDVIYLAIAAFFLITIETRIKRRRALGALHELRAIAHVIDMHQLTKDPEIALARAPATGLVAARPMSLFELSRYPTTARRRCP